MKPIIRLIALLLCVPVLGVTQGSRARAWARENVMRARAWARENVMRAQVAHTDSTDKAAPSIPDGTSIPLDIELPKGKKLPVYSGPGEKYARAGNGCRCSAGKATGS